MKAAGSIPKSRRQLRSIAKIARLTRSLTLKMRLMNLEIIFLADTESSSQTNSQHPIFLQLLRLRKATGESIPPKVIKRLGSLRKLRFRPNQATPKSRKPIVNLASPRTKSVSQKFSVFPLESGLNQVTKWSPDILDPRPHQLRS
jgi:hypothetical protein